VLYAAVRQLLKPLKPPVNLNNILKSSSYLTGNTTCNSDEPVMFREIIAIIVDYGENRTEHTNTLCRQNAVL
jgi:hypothetical protein